MKQFVLIREFQSSDNLNCQTLIKDYVMSYSNDAFISCLFREITIQMIVLVWALMFIFFGFPLIVCFWSIPLVIFLIYVSVKGSYYNKAMELASQNPEYCLVAEVYEPYFLRCSPKDMAYDYYTQTQFNSLQLGNDPKIQQFRKEIIGSISIREHYSLDNCGWIWRSAICPRYSIDKVGEELINQALEYCVNRGYYQVETVTTECQSEIRELMTRVGFTLKQIYHKQVIAHVRIMKSQLGIDLLQWAKSKQKCL